MDLNDFGLTLDSVSGKGHIECLKFLVDNFKKTGTPLCYVKSALNSASVNGQSECLKYIIEHIEDIPLNYLESAYNSASAMNRSECATILDGHIQNLRNVPENEDEQPSKRRRLS